MLHNICISAVVMSPWASCSMAGGEAGGKIPWPGQLAPHPQKTRQNFIQKDFIPFK